MLAVGADRRPAQYLAGPGTGRKYTRTDLHS
jgi:hypothetical protein